MRSKNFQSHFLIILVKYIKNIILISTRHDRVIQPSRISIFQLGFTIYSLKFSSQLISLKFCNKMVGKIAIIDVKWGLSVSLMRTSAMGRGDVG